MKKLLLSSALLFSIIPAYSMEAEDGKHGEGNNERVIVRKKKAAKELTGKAEEGGGKEVGRKSPLFPRVLFSPGKSIDLVLGGFIGQEKKQMRGAFYSFGLENLAAMIERRIKAGVAASFVVNEKKANGVLCSTIQKVGGALYVKSQKRNMSSLAQIGGTNFEHMHSKFIIFDDNFEGKKLVITGSYNPTDQGQKNWENLVILDDKNVVRDFEQEYRGMLKCSRLIAGNAIKMDSATEEKEEEEEGQAMRFPRACFCPDLDVLLSKLIAQEQAEIKGAFFRFTLYNLAEDMAKKFDREDPFQVTMVVDKSNIEEDFCEALNLIASHGGSVRKIDGDNRQMHHKFMLFRCNQGNNPLVWTGSFQGTGQSCRNWENVVILNDKRSVDEFQSAFGTLLENSQKISQDELKTKAQKSELAFKLNRIPRPTGPIGFEMEV